MPLVVVAGTLALGGPAAAADANWLASPVDGDFNNGANWGTASVPDGTAFFGASGITSLSFSADTSIGGWVFGVGAANYSFSNAQTLSFNGGGITVDGGGVEIVNDNRLYFFNNSTAGNAGITNNFELSFFNGSSAGSAVIVNNDGASFFDTSKGGNATITNNGYLFFTGSATAENAEITNNSLLRFWSTSTAADAVVTTTGGGNTVFLGSGSGGNARFITQAGGTFDLSNLSSAGTTAGSIEGAGNYDLGSKNLAVGSNDLSATVSGVIADGGSGGGVGGGLRKTGIGTLTLSGTNTYTGATTVDDGILHVDGSIASSSLTTVNAGGRLGGIGTLGNTSINGGTLGPGNSIGTITVQGSLGFGPGSTYEVEVSPTDADRTDVTGTASLDGTVHASFQSGAYVERDYTILSAAGGLGGSTFDSLATTDLPAGFAASLDYSGNDVLLNLEATFTPPAGGLARNQQNVADAVAGYFNGGGALPPEFVTLFALTGEELESALAQISGEATTAAQQSTMQSTNQFLGLMFAPRSPAHTAAGNGPALGAMPVRAVPIGYAAGEGAVSAGPEEQLWTAWASVFGGASVVDGGSSASGVSGHAAGFAAGVDYHDTAGATVGLAFSGARGFWGLSDGLGGGASKDYQVGLNGTMRWDNIYAAAAGAYGFHELSTGRYVFGGSRLTADFGAHSVGGRLEGGTRLEMEEGSGITPYAALQAQRFLASGYSEDDPANSGFALSYGPRASTSVRAEFGSRFDHVLTLDDGSVLNLNARLAYARDWIDDPSVAATFQTLPGASFIVGGASPPRSLALASVAAELALGNGVALSGRFDGEFAQGAASCAGIGAIRVSW